MTHGTFLALPDADLTFFDGIDWRLSLDAAMSQLTAEIPWRQESITLFGRTHMQPRLICWMGDEGVTYRYSGKTYVPEPWHSLVARLRERVEAIAAAPFNSVLLNLYRNGSDAMGYHADDEPELGPAPVIASLSLGAERAMRFRHRTDPSLTARIPLPAGSLLVMRGATQEHWKHAVPRTRRPAGPRINLTFRQVSGSRSPGRGRDRGA